MGFAETLGISGGAKRPPLDAVVTPLLFKRRPVAHEHDLARHASLPEQFVRLPCLGKWKSLREEWTDLLLLKEVEQGDQILSKQCRFQPFEPLDAVGDHPFPTRKKPAGDREWYRSRSNRRLPPADARQAVSPHYGVAGGCRGLSHRRKEECSRLKRRSTRTWRRRVQRRGKLQACRERSAKNASEDSPLSLRRLGSRLYGLVGRF